MLQPIVEQMAPLAECLEVAVALLAMRGGVIEVEGRPAEGEPELDVLGPGGQDDLTALTVAPGLPFLVPSAAARRALRFMALVVHETQCLGLRVWKAAWTM